MSKPPDPAGPSPDLSRQVEVLREVLQDPRAPDACDEREHSQSASMLEPYLGQFFEGIAVIAPDGRFRLFTAGLEHITGKRAEQVGSLRDLVVDLAPDLATGEEQWEPIEHCWHRRESPEHLITIVDGTGGERWLRIKLHRVNEDTLVHVLDVTAIHTARTHTPHSIEHYRALLDNLGIGIYSLDDPASGSVSYANPACRRIMGLREDFGPGDLSSFMLYETPEDRVRLLKALVADGFTRSRTVRFETRLLRMDDRRPVPLRFTATASYGRDGSMRRIDGAIEDLSEQKAFEAARAEHRLLIDSLFEHTAVGISVGALDGTYLAVNPAYCELTGYTEAELVGNNSAMVTHPEDRHLTGEHIGRALREGRKMASFTKRYVRKDGEVIRVAITVAGVQDETGSVTAGIGLFERMTDEG